MTPARVCGSPVRAASAAALVLLASACAWFRDPEVVLPPVVAEMPSEYQIGLPL